MNEVENEYRKPNSRLFAIIYINRRQFKVTENDLVVLYDSLPVDVGDKIKFEKVMHTISMPHAKKTML